MLLPAVLLISLIGASCGQGIPKPCNDLYDCDNGFSCDLATRTCLKLCYTQDDCDVPRLMCNIPTNRCVPVSIACLEGGRCHDSLKRCYPLDGLCYPPCLSNMLCPKGSTCEIHEQVCLPIVKRPKKPRKPKSPRGKKPKNPLPSPPDNTDTGNSNCKDNFSSECPKYKYLCDDSLYFDLMTENCAKTCKRCGQSGIKGSLKSGNGENNVADGGNGKCADLHAPGRSSDCPRRKYLCENKIYNDIMRVQCPKTCGYC